MAEIVQKGLDEKYCNDCGAIIKIKAVICPKCGVPQSGVISSGDLEAGPKAPKVFGILFVIFGSFGILNGLLSPLVLSGSSTGEKIFFLVMYLLSSIPELLAGIFLLQRKNLGRIFGLIYAYTSLALGLFSLFVLIMGSPMGTAQILLINQVVGCIAPIVALIFLHSGKFRQALK